MHIKFSLAYSSLYGESVYLTGSTPELGWNKEKDALPMQYKGTHWEVEIEVNNSDEFDYSYLICQENGEMRCETLAIRKFRPGEFSEYIVRDEWIELSSVAPFNSSAFRKVLTGKEKKNPKTSGNCIIRLSMGLPEKNKSLIICGSEKDLGEWNPDKGVPMHINEDGIPESAIQIEKTVKNIEYKFVLVTENEDGTMSFRWEEGENRSLQLFPFTENTRIIVTHSTINVGISEVRLSGISVPLFSLRSKDSCGIGDFVDLKAMIDFVSLTGQNVLQLLPVNDTTNTHTWRDSYPYSATSAFALHPLYLNLQKAGKITDLGFLKEFQEKSKKLNRLQFVDYEKVEKLKWSYINMLFLQEGEKTLASTPFNLFYLKNKEWLLPYALFSSLRERFKNPNFRKWPENSKWDETLFSGFNVADPGIFPEIRIFLFVQYHLHLQLEEAHNYAVAKKVILKGDLPIGVDINSVDVWRHPEFFITESQAGAPPDDFSVLGQNWKFPVYNWDNLEKDNYSWFRKRIQKMAEFFDAYRIDHILGFFRIWEIPARSGQALKGKFNPSNPLSPEEILLSGYNFNFESDCKPIINDNILAHYFGQESDLIKKRFLKQIGNNNYELKEEFSTEQKILNIFPENIKPTKQQKHIRDGLISVLSEILFVHEPDKPKRVCPRIAAQYTVKYQLLENGQKAAYNKLYDDFYYSRHNHYWYMNGMKKLRRILSFSNMLVCGEDLGMIPESVPKAMDTLKILTLEIPRMPKNNSSRFSEPARYPYLSVSTSGTHDMSTIRGWWTEDREITKEFCRTFLPYLKNIPQDCEPQICEKILELILGSPSMLAVLPLQDWLSISKEHHSINTNNERINIPSNPQNYWKYRMNDFIEGLKENKQLCHQMKKMVRKSGRTLR